MINPNTHTAREQWVQDSNLGLDEVVVSGLDHKSPPARYGGGEHSGWERGWLWSLPAWFSLQHPTWRTAHPQAQPTSQGGPPTTVVTGTDVAVVIPAKTQRALVPCRALS